SFQQGSEDWLSAMHALLRWRSCELLTDMAYSAGRFTEAVRYAEEAAATMPQIAATRYRHGRALNALGHLDEAIAAYRAALDLNPFLGEARLALAQCLLDSGLPSEARAV